VGDFVGKDEPLFALYGNVSGIDENILVSSINFGIERTVTPLSQADRDRMVTIRKRSQSIKSGSGA
jgi:hypothetical protein